MVNFSSSSRTSTCPMCCLRRKGVAPGETPRAHLLPLLEARPLFLRRLAVEPEQLGGSELAQDVAEHVGHEADQAVVEGHVLTLLLVVDDGAGAGRAAGLDGPARRARPGRLPAD